MSLSWFFSNPFLLLCLSNAYIFSYLIFVLCISIRILFFIFSSLCKWFGNLISWKLRQINFTILQDEIVLGLLVLYIFFFKLNVIKTKSPSVFGCINAWSSIDSILLVYCKSLCKVILRNVLCFFSLLHSCLALVLIWLNYGYHLFISFLFCYLGGFLSCVLINVLDPRQSL